MRVWLVLQKNSVNTMSLFVVATYPMIVDYIRKQHKKCTVYESVSDQHGSKFYLQFQYCVLKEWNTQKNPPAFTYHIGQVGNETMFSLVTRYEKIRKELLSDEACHNCLLVAKQAVETFLSEATGVEYSGSWYSACTGNKLTLRYVSGDTLKNVDRNFISGRYLAYEFARFFNEYVNKCIASKANDFKMQNPSADDLSRLDALMRMSCGYKTALEPRNDNDVLKLVGGTPLVEDIYSRDQWMVVWGCSEWANPGVRLHRVDCKDKKTRYINLTNDCVGSVPSCTVEFQKSLCSEGNACHSNATYSCSNNYPYADAHYQNIISVYGNYIEEYDLMLSHLKLTHRPHNCIVGLVSYRHITKHCEQINSVIKDVITREHKHMILQCPIRAAANGSEKMHWKELYRKRKTISSSGVPTLSRTTLVRCTDHAFKQTCNVPINDFVFHDCGEENGGTVKYPNAMVMISKKPRTTRVHCIDCQTTYCIFM